MKCRKYIEREPKLLILTCPRAFKWTRWMFTHKKLFLCSRCENDRIISSTSKRNLNFKHNSQPTFHSLESHTRHNEAIFIITNSIHKNLIFYLPQQNQILWKLKTISDIRGIIRIFFPLSRKRPISVKWITPPTTPMFVYFFIISHKIDLWKMICV